MRWRRPPRKGRPDFERRYGLLAVGLIALGVTYLKVIGPRLWDCGFRMMTGLPCPSCGATRSLAALVGGDPIASFRFNPLFFCVFLVGGAWVVYAVVAWLAKLPRLRVLISHREIPKLVLLGATLVLVSWTFLIVDGRGGPGRPRSVSEILRTLHEQHLPLPPADDGNRAT